MRPIKDRLKTWYAIHGTSARAIAIVCLGCAAVGAFTLDPQQKIGYEPGTVTYIGVREGSKSPGVRMRIQTADGRDIWLTSRAYNPDLQTGSTLCLLKTRGQFTGRTLYRHALPARCQNTNRSFRSSSV